MVVYTCPSIIVLFIFITDNTITFENANDIITFQYREPRVCPANTPIAYFIFFAPLL